MKRAVSLLLALLLAVSLAAPALAEEGGDEYAIDTMMPALDETVQFPVPEEDGEMDALLSELTLQVKQTLQIDDGYTDFYSSYYDGLSPRWSLTWSDDERQLSAEVSPEGTILNVYRWNYDSDKGSFQGFDPAFPAMTEGEARAQAESWCGRLFSGVESARLDDVRIFLGGESYYRVSGTVEMNGLESPVTFTMVLDGSGLSSFYRSGSDGFVGEIPPVTEEEHPDPAPTLAGAVELELRWISDGENGAKLAYMPVGPRTVVDPATGEAVDMDALYESFDRDYGVGWNAVYTAEAPEAEMAAADGGAALTETELASIENYSGVMDAAAIDQALRAIDGLGLEDFVQARCSYSLDSETGAVTASVRYTGTMTDQQLYGYSAQAYAAAVEQGQDMTIYKYIAVDAKTGALKSVSTSYPLWERDGTEPGAEVQAELAVPFAEQVAPELAAQAAPCTLAGYEERDGVVLAQVHEGYFYPDNRIELHADPSSGVIDRFFCVWDEDVDFGSAEEPVDMDAALAAYTDALEVTLGYVAWPIDVTLEENAVYAAYLDWGYTYVEELRLAYYYSGLEELAGVDAITGEPIPASGDQEQGFVYDDLDGADRAEMIRTLGASGVGFEGGSFRPERELSWRDGAILLLRAGGAYVDETDDEALLEQAFYQRFLPERNWDPDGTMSRMEFIKMLLRPSRYGDAAELLSYDGEQGYAVIALALGMDTDGLDQTATRADAAAFLYQFMDR